MRGREKKLWVGCSRCDKWRRLPTVEEGEKAGEIDDWCVPPVPLETVSLSTQTSCVCPEGRSPVPPSRVRASGV